MYPENQPQPIDHSSVSNVSASNVTASNVSASNVSASNVSASNVSASNVTASNVTASTMQSSVAVAEPPLPEQVLQEEISPEQASPEQAIPDQTHKSGQLEIHHQSRPSATAISIEQPSPLEIQAREQAIALFHRTYATTRAYKDFVDKAGTDVGQIQDAADFERIPLMTKEDYLHKYPIEDRLVDGRTLADCYMMTATTGSTGKPVLWPRDYQTDLGLVSAFERVYRGCFRIDERRTLHIIQNFLGTTPAGMVMSQLSWAASANHQMTTITPGEDIQRALDLIEAMASGYEQIVVSTYPPYVNAFLDQAEARGMNLADYGFKFVCTGEKFSEPWRNHIVNRLGGGAARHDIVSTYGCTEAGLVGAETPFSVALAEAASHHKEASQELFGTTEIPNIVGYNPMNKLIEAYGNEPSTQEILLTADQPVPLIRYNIHDRGGILSGAEINSVIKERHLPLASPPDDAHFVYLFGRSDCVLLLTIAVYIEEIRYCLEHSQFGERFTGEFQYGTFVDENYRDELNVVVRLKSGCAMREDEEEQFHHEFWENLLTVNPILRLPSEDMLNSTMLAIRFSHEEDNSGLKSGKYRYFL